MLKELSVLIQSIIWQLFPLPHPILCTPYSELPVKLVVYSVQTGFPSPSGVTDFCFVWVGGSVAKGVGARGMGIHEKSITVYFLTLSQFGFVPLPDPQSLKMSVASSQRQMPQERPVEGENELH